MKTIILSNYTLIYNACKIICLLNCPTFFITYSLMNECIYGYGILKEITFEIFSE